MKKDTFTGWKVLTGGTMVYYHIGQEIYDIMEYRFGHEHLISELTEKRWFNLSDFLPRYEEAMIRVGYSQIEIENILRRAINQR
jgi:hypothetical protein